MYILVILILHSFGLTPFGHHPQYTLVDSVEKAAISVYLDKQNNISAGDAVKAALAAYNYLLKRSKTTPAAE